MLSEKVYTWFQSRRRLLPLLGWPNSHVKCKQASWQKEIQQSLDVECCSFLLNLHSLKSSFLLPVICIWIPTQSSVIRIYLLSHIAYILSGTYPVTYPLETLVHSSGIKRPEYKADHSSSSAQVNAWIYTAIPPYVCMAKCFVKYQGQLYLYYSNTYLHKR